MGKRLVECDEKIVLTRIFSKMAKAIDTSTTKHQDTLDRFLSLCNVRLNKILRQSSPENTARIIGGSMGLHARYIAKFGTFVSRPYPVQLDKR